MSIFKLGEIDLNRKPVNPQLFLCKPNKEIIAKMNEAYDIVYDLQIGALDELSFKLPYYIDKHHHVSMNENADGMMGRYLVKLKLGNFVEYFIINRIDKIGNDEEIVDVRCLSLGYELNDRIIRSLEMVSKTASEQLNTVLKDTLWSVGYIDSEFDLKYRGLDISSNTVLEVVFEIAKTFNAVVLWDTAERKISFYRPENVGENKGFKIKYGKYLESLNQEDNSEEIVTRLKLYGKEEISIQSVNPTGSPYIEDLTYFIYPYQEEKDYDTKEFSAEEVVSNWTHDENWINDNGVVKLDANTTEKSIIINNNDFNKNYKISARFKAIEKDNVFGIVGRYIDENNYYYIGYESGRLDGGLDWSPDHVRVYKVVDGIETLIASSNGTVAGWSNNISYLIEVEFNNDLIMVWIDEVLVLSTRDQTFSSGGYGFFGQSQPFFVSDIVVLKKDYEVLNHSLYMSDELAHYLLEYDNKLQNYKSVFKTLLDEKIAINEILFTKEMDLFNLQTELKTLLDERDVLNTRIARKDDEIDQADNTYSDVIDLLKEEMIQLQVDLANVLTEISIVEEQISDKENEIIIVEQDMQEVDNDIEQLRVALSISNNFTPELADERKQYIIEREWSNNNIEDPEDLLEEGIVVFNQLKEQRITLKIDVVNFLNMITEQRNWDKLNLGDEFKIEHERMNVLYSAKITAIQYDFENDSINITISNVKDAYNNQDKFLDMLYKSYSTSTQVSIDHWKWDLSLENKGSINEIINNIWDANRQAIIGAKDQVVEISDRGLIIRDPNDPDVYLVGLNGMIAITNDGGDTWKHAITSEGIVGERVYGKVIMGVNLAIEDENGILKFQGSKGEIFDRDGKLVMKLGLVEEDPEQFGLIALNDITQVKVTDGEGFVIERKTNDTINYPDGWEKIFWTNQSDGTVFAHDIVASNIKIVNDKNWQNEIINAETGMFDIGFFNKIVKDNKLTTDEKLQIITELYQIYSSYQTLLEQAKEYQKSNRDNIVDLDAPFDTDEQKFPETPSTIDRYSTEPLTNAYIALIEYIKDYVKVNSESPHIPLEIDINHDMTETTSEVLPDRATFILKFKDYYDEYEKLRNAIEDAIFYSGVNMGSYYNNLLMGDYGFVAVRNDGRYRAYLNATNGLALQKWEDNKWVNKVYASIGNPEYDDGTLIAEDLIAKRLRIETKFNEVLLDADALNFDFTVLNSIIYDDIIMSPEKSTLLNQFNSLTEQKNKLSEQITKYVNTVYNDRDTYYYELDSAKNSLSSAQGELNTAYSNLKSVLDIVFEDMNVKTVISLDLGMTREQFQDLFRNFYQKYEIARNRLEDFLEKSSLQLGRNYNNTLIDAINGITVTRGNMMNRTRLNATDGISIARNDGTAYNPIWHDVFYVDTDGNLFAEDITTKGLKIVNGMLGSIILDAVDGITINGQYGEQIRLNQFEGIAIDVYGDPRFWIDIDGTLRAKKLVIVDDLEAPIEAGDGSYISDLTVNELKSLGETGTADYVHITEDFLSIRHGDGDNGDQIKWEVHLKNDDKSTPQMQWGMGDPNGNNIAFMEKSGEGFKLDYWNTYAHHRKFYLLNDDTNAVILTTEAGNIKIESGTSKALINPQKIRFEVGSSSIELTSSGVKINGSRIDLN